MLVVYEQNYHQTHQPLRIDQSLFPNLAVFLIELITPPLIIVGSNFVFEKLKLLKKL